MHFGHRLKAERERLGFNQTDFASAAGVVLHTQIKYEKNQSSPSIEYWQNVVTIGVDVGYVIANQTTPHIEEVVAQLKKQQSMKPVSISIGGIKIPNKIDYGIRLKEQRIDFKLTQPELAEIGGVTRTTQLSYEKSRTSPPVSYWEKLYKKGFDIIYIITGVAHIQTLAEHMEWREKNHVMVKEPEQKDDPSYDDLKNQNGMLRKLLQESLKQIQQQANELKSVLDFLDK